MPERVNGSETREGLCTKPKERFAAGGVDCESGENINVGKMKEDQEKNEIEKELRNKNENKVK